MKSEIDQILKEKGLDGYLVLGNGSHNPAMVYLTGGGHISNAVLVKKTGEEPFLVVNAMEREEGARTGIRTRTINEFHFFEILQSAGGDLVEAESQFLAAILTEAGLVSGKVVLYGQIELAEKWDVFQKLGKRLPQLELVGDSENLALGQARLVKDNQELERIRKMGVVTTNTVERVAKYIQSCSVKDDLLYTAEGNPLTIGEIKNKIDFWLAEQGAENPEGTIFAMGRDAGIPHSTGNPDDVLRLGSPIVFDIYPCEKGGGYFYDFTRTWCIGYAPEAVQKLYDQVQDVYNQVVGDLTVGASCKQYQKWTCDLFEGMGHPTIQSQNDTTDGYNHSLGHGVGMQVHEAPWFGVNALGTQILKPGEVFTIEPGLYYPEKGMGVRIEDTYYVADDNTICRFVDYPYDLVIPLKGN